MMLPLTMMLPLEDKHVGISRKDFFYFNRNISVADYHIHVQNIDFVKKMADFCCSAIEFRDCRPQISDFGKQIPRRQKQLRVQDRKKMGLFDGMLRLITGMFCSEMAMLRSYLRRTRLEIGITQVRISKI
jgi:hypothetical protein